MPKVKLTDRWIQSARAGDGREEVGDLLCPGLYIRFSKKGGKSFSLVMRVGSKVQRVTLGRYPVLTLAAAREEALRLMREVADGRPPITRAAIVAAARRTEPETTFAALLDTYEQHIRQNARSWQMIMSSLRRKELAALHAKAADAVARRELMEVIDGIAAGGNGVRGTPHAATNLLRHLKMVLNWAVERGRLPANPLDKARPPKKPTERDRVLSDAELAAVWAGCEVLPQPWRSMFRMLALTGQRRTEVARMRWEEVQGDTWVIPRERVKKDRPHAVPLTAGMLALLAPLRRTEHSGFVFSTDEGRSASSNYYKTKSRVDAVCGFADWHLHDLRRTVRSGLAALGVPEVVARAVLNHAEGKIDRIYNRHDYLAEKREALERWDVRVRAISHGKEACTGH